ncbi:16S rRNA (guanine(527)-N(7))-methyltransferase RsmG [Conexibacter sp. DBS9H8]|uniref:16S rRNA (guanine(527)-N(7))-methyltransferase RsmG n=1 Tax=Conexibacter sp. DBS9H8 TaxID=2937801 RepID=UPI0035316BE3
MSAPDLSALRSRYDLSAVAEARLRELLALLSADEFAPTTVRVPERVRDDHIADALVALELEVVRSARTLVDVGSGAGVPGLPLAIALPEARVTLIEANGRKCDFLRRAVEQLALANVTILPSRAEEVAQAAREGWDIVTARALAPLAVVAEYAAPLLRVGGVLVAWRGQREPEVEAEADGAAKVLGLSAQIVRHVEPYPGASHRHLHLMSKVSPTPSRFPRRPGVARKRPLGSG